MARRRSLRLQKKKADQETKSVAKALSQQEKEQAEQRVIKPIQKTSTSPTHISSITSSSETNTTTIKQEAAKTVVKRRRGRRKAPRRRRTRKLQSVEDLDLDTIQTFEYERLIKHLDLSENARSKATTLSDLVSIASKLLDGWAGVPWRNGTETLDQNPLISGLQMVSSWGAAHVLPCPHSIKRMGVNRGMATILWAPDGHVRPRSDAALYLPESIAARLVSAPPRPPSRRKSTSRSSARRERALADDTSSTGTASKKARHALEGFPSRAIITYESELGQWLSAEGAWPTGVLNLPFIRARDSFSTLGVKPTPAKIQQFYSDPIWFEIGVMPTLTPLSNASRVPFYSCSIPAKYSRLVEQGLAYLRHAVDTQQWWKNYPSWCSTFLVLHPALRQSTARSVVRDLLPAFLHTQRYEESEEEEEEEDVSPSGTDVEGAEAEVAEAESGDVQMDTDEQKQAEDAEERPEEEQVVEEEEESSSSTGIPSNRELFGLPHYEHWGSMLYFCTLTLEQREVEELRQLFETRCIGMLPPIRQKARMREEIDGFLARASPVSGFKAPVWSRMNVKERGEKLVQAWNVCYFSASLRLPYRLPFSFLDLFERLHNFRRSYDAALPMTNPSKVLPAALSRAKLIRKHSSQMPSARMMADSHSSGRVRECLADSDNMFYAVTHTIFGLSCWCTASLPGNTLREEQRFIWRCIIAAAAGGSLNPDIAAEAVLVLSCFRFGSNDDEEEDGDGDDPDGDAHVIADGTQALIDWLRDYIAQVASTSPVLRSASRQIDLGLGGGLVSPRCFIPRHFGWKESSKYHATQLAVSALHLPALFGKSPFWDYLMANEHY